MWYAKDMRRKWSKWLNLILVFCITAGGFRYGISRSLTSEAATISGIQQEIDRLQKQLEEEYGKISGLEAEQDLILEKMEDADSELINTMASISLKDEEIAEKEGEIAVKEGEIAEKERQITLTEAEYEETRQQEQKQREDMAIRTRMLYEQGTDTYLNAFLEGVGFSDILNRMDYVERIYEYSKCKLDGFIETANQLQDLWDLLEQEKADLEESRKLLVEDQAELEAEKDKLKEQKENLNAMLAKLKKESADYDARISKARQEAAAAKTLLKQNQDRLTQMQTAQAMANGTYTSDYASIINNAAGSDLGKKIANYACQYIGNPYKAAGTSLTDGADCSGFTYRVYSNFGYKLPRTSYEQRSAGTGVTYEEAQPGDLICYDGHVAMYIGGGLIVHASNSNPYPRGGIKISNAKYRTILAVRRIL